MQNLFFNLKAQGKLFLILIALPTLFSLTNQPTHAEADKYVHDQVMEVTAKPLDPRAQVLKDYLYEKNSPMAEHAQDFIDAADAYDLDWKLVPAISGVESNFGKFIPGGYNAWGWGVYGDQALGFTSWKDGIYTLNKGLKENYINRGLTNPYAMNRVYASSPTWGMKVSYFLSDLETYAKNHKVALPKAALAGTINEKVAGESASLALSSSF